MATCVKLSRYDRSVRHEAVSPKASSDDRLDELYRATLGLMGSPPLYEVSIADVTAAAAVSKPLLYHYFSTRTELYVATSRWAADQLRGATRPDPTLPPPVCMQQSLNAHLGRVDDNANVYRAVLQGGMSSHPEVRQIVEESRDDVVCRLAEGLHPRARHQPNASLSQPGRRSRPAHRSWLVED